MKNVRSVKISSEPWRYLPVVAALTESASAASAASVFDTLVVVVVLLAMLTLEGTLQGSA